MTNSQKIIKNKLGILELARQLGNVFKACKLMGYSLDWSFKLYSDKNSSPNTIIIMSREVKYSREFKLAGLNLLQECKSISEISKSLGIRVNTSCAWRKCYKL